MSFEGVCQKKDCKDDYFWKNNLIRMNYSDQLNNTFEFNSKPKRIISLVPSQSEYLWDLGLRKELIGITKFCIHPNRMYRSVERIGGTKKLNLKKIESLNPDLIIGNKEENEQVQIEELRKKYPVWMSEIKNFEDAFEMMTELGKITGNKNKSIQIVNHIKESIAEIKNIFEMKSVAYFIWYEPMMFAGRDTFINNILNFIGLKNVAEDFSRYPELDEKKLMSLNPEFCFLSSEPYPFKDKHKSEIQKMLPHTKILFVDGEMFSWYGTRMMKMSSYIKKLRKEINSI